MSVTDSALPMKHSHADIGSASTTATSHGGGLRHRGSSRSNRNSATERSAVSTSPVRRVITASETRMCFYCAGIIDSTIFASNYVTFWQETTCRYIIKPSYCSAPQHWVNIATAMWYIMILAYRLWKTWKPGKLRELGHSGTVRENSGNYDQPQGILWAVGLHIRVGCTVTKNKSATHTKWKQIKNEGYSRSSKCCILLMQWFQVMQCCVSLVIFCKASKGISLTHPTPRIRLKLALQLMTCSGNKIAKPVFCYFRLNRNWNQFIDYYNFFLLPT